MVRRRIAARAPAKMAATTRAENLALYLRLPSVFSGLPFRQVLNCARGARYALNFAACAAMWLPLPVPGALREIGGARTAGSRTSGTSKSAFIIRRDCRQSAPIRMARIQKVQKRFRSAVCIAFITIALVKAGAWWEG